MGAASIDDVFFTSGACKEGSAIGEACTFTDYSQCGFTQNSSASSLLWQTHSGGDNQLNTIPIPTDHTTGTRAGSYIYIDLEGQNENLQGRLYSPMYPSTINQSYCVEFYYALLGSNNTFDVYTENSDGTKRIIFTRSNDHGLVWNKGEITVTTFQQFQVVFEITTGRTRQGFVALDDYMYKQGECSYRSNECTFDDGTLCSWTNAGTNQFDWLLHTGQTPTLNTGPDGDHSMSTI